MSGPQTRPDTAVRICVPTGKSLPEAWARARPFQTRSLRSRAWGPRRPPWVRFWGGPGAPAGIRRPWVWTWCREGADFSSHTSLGLTDWPADYIVVSLYCQPGPQAACTRAVAAPPHVAARSYWSRAE